jgi:hypothetical protein
MVEGVHRIEKMCTIVSGGTILLARRFYGRIKQIKKICENKNL